MLGLLNILKPPGMSSHDVVAFIREVTGERRVGHTGTLDPFAAGVLVVCVGRATKIIQFLQDDHKQYRAEICLGIRTDTLDGEGEVTSRNEDCRLGIADLKRCLKRFVGEIQQTPPMASAIKHRGCRLYKMAREGRRVRRKQRTVHIYSCVLVDTWDLCPQGDLVYGSRIMLDVDCSRGTYIRSLAADLGEVCGCGAYLSFLVRTRSGQFRLRDSKTLEELAKLDRRQLESELIPMDAVLSHLPAVSVPEGRNLQLLRHGNPVPLGDCAGNTNMVGSSSGEADQFLRVYDGSGQVVCIARLVHREGKQVLRPYRVLQQ